MVLTVSELREALDGLPDEAKVCLVLGAYGRSHTVSWADGTGSAHIEDGEFDDSLPGGEYFYIVEGGQRRNSPYLTSEEKDGIDCLLD
jgi:hypothetical protein